MSYVLGNIAKQSKVSISITPAATNTVTCVEQTFTVNGLKVGDMVSGCTSNAAQTGGIGIAGARVTAANTLGITFINPTAGNLTAVAGAYNFVLSRADAVSGDGNI